MLCEELKDSDIPHRTRLREYIMKTWGDHLDTLQNEMGVCITVSFYELLINNSIC